MPDNDTPVVAGIQLDGDAINQYLVKAILDSVIGERVKKAVDEVLSDLLKTGLSLRDNAIKAIVEEEARTLLREYMKTEPIQAALKAAIDKHFTPERIASIAESLTITVSDRY